MPTYEYKCKDCETQVSDVRSINDPEPTINCAVCGKPMTKMFNLGAISFKGSGFYRTDK